MSWDLIHNSTWWYHNMETLSKLLAFISRIQQRPVDSSHKGPIMHTFENFYCDSPVQTVEWMFKLPLKWDAIMLMGCYCSDLNLCDQNQQEYWISEMVKENLERLCSYQSSPLWPSTKLGHVDGSMQERCNSIANALELHLSCTNPSVWGLNDGK